MSKDPFGFDLAAAEEPLDIAVFAPKPRSVDRHAAAAGRQVARDSGFTTRRRPRDLETHAASPAAAIAPPPAAKAEPPAKPPKGGKRRINISELLGIQDRYPDTERAQLNMLAPVPIVLRWRKLVTAQAPLQAWEVLEAAMDALEAADGAADGSQRSPADAA